MLLESEVRFDPGEELLAPRTRWRLFLRRIVLACPSPSTATRTLRVKIALLARLHSLSPSSPSFLPHHLYSHSLHPHLPAGAHTIFTGTSNSPVTNQNVELKHELINAVTANEKALTRTIFVRRIPLVGLCRQAAAHICKWMLQLSLGSVSG